MGLLDAIFSAGDSAKRRIRGLLADPVGNLEQTAGMLSDDRKLAAERNKRMIEQPQTVSAEDVQALLGGGASFAPAAMTVWHGSPHKFSKFDMSKIGTGEGAQAYGHGLYMAENPNIAASYQEKLSKIPLDGGYDSMQRFLTYGKTKPRRVDMNAPSNSLTPAETALSYMHMNKGSAFDASQDIRSMIEMMPPDVDKYKKALKVLESGKLKRGLLGEDYGNMYKVDIPDEAVARFLDWDKPLSQQAPEVQAALANTKNKQLRAMVEYANVPYSEMAGGEAKTMGEAFRLLNLNLQGKSSADSAKASALLAKQGIPGIRYLDGGSRSAGQGSSNFVLFDDQLPRILETNGVPTGLQPWQPGEWGGLLK